MKKLMVLMMAAFMAVGLVGTASAVDYTRSLSNANTLTFFASPVVESGGTVYLLAGGPVGNQASSGASVQMIDPATGVSSFWLGAATTAGSSAYGTPAVISGETLFVQVYNTASAANTGTSLVAINGSTGATYYTVNIPRAAQDSVGTDFPGGGRFLGAGTTGYAAPLTIDPAGTTIYGVSGVSQLGTGVSIWSLKISNGSLTSFGTGVSTIFAAPIVSGNSIYVMGTWKLGAGTPGASTGVSLIAFNKSTGATDKSVNIVGGTSSATPFATPAIAGNSIFVVDATGGLTAYSTTALTAGVSDFVQFARAASSQVTASPVTDGRYLAVTMNNLTDGAAGITVYNLTYPLGGPTAVTGGTPWWFSYPAGTTITATPAISNGVLYVAANTTSTGGVIDRFNLAGHSGKITAADYTQITKDSNGNLLGFFDYSSPIISGSRLIIVSNGGTGNAGATTANKPVLYSFDLGANGNAAWPQFKFDAARTGANTAHAAAATVYSDDDSGCFISTIK